MIINRGRAGIHDEPTTGFPAVDAYLDAVARRLSGPRRVRAELLAELRSGLLDSVAAHRARAVSDREAAVAATADFGRPKMVADAFSADLLVAQARHTAYGLLGSGPLVGLAWILAALLSRLGLPTAPPLVWADLSGPSHPLLDTGARAIGLAACIAILAIAVTAIYSLASTGRFGRRPRENPGHAVTAAALACAAAVLTDLCVLGIVATDAVTSPARLAAVPVAAAALLSISRVVLAGRAARDCLAGSCR